MKYETLSDFVDEVTNALPSRLHVELNAWPTTYPDLPDVEHARIQVRVWDRESPDKVYEGVDMFVPWGQKGEGDYHLYYAGSILQEYKIYRNSVDLPEIDLQLADRRFTS